MIDAVWETTSTEKLNIRPNSVLRVENLDFGVRKL